MSGWFTEQVDVSMTSIHPSSFSSFEKQRRRNSVKTTTSNILIVEDERGGSIESIKALKQDTFRSASSTESERDTLEVSEIAFGYVYDYLFRNGHNDVLHLLQQSIETNAQLVKIYRQCVAKTSNGCDCGLEQKDLDGSLRTIEQLLEARLGLSGSSACSGNPKKIKKRKSGRPRTSRMFMAEVEKADAVKLVTEDLIDSANLLNTCIGSEQEQCAVAQSDDSCPRKSVRFGLPGRTPTKEYIFFRDTPPKFVTETLEDAIQINEKLRDELAKEQESAQDRYIELQSNDVSKYNVGQMIQNLGPDQNLTGVVTKVYGTRQCGTSGPGTIVIDTCIQGPVASSRL